MVSAVVRVSNRHCSAVRQLPFHPDGALQAIIGLELRVHDVDGILPLVERGRIGNIGIESGVINGVFKLVDTVVQKGVLKGAESDAIVEDSVSAADYCLLRTILGIAGSPRET